MASSEGSGLIVAEPDGSQRLCACTAQSVEGRNTVLVAGPDDIRQEHAALRTAVFVGDVAQGRAAGDEGQRLSPARAHLNGLNGEKHEVFDEADFLLDEGLSVTNACEQAVVPRCGEGALADVVLGNEEESAGGLIGVL